MICKHCGGEFEEPIGWAYNRVIYCYRPECKASRKRAERADYDRRRRLRDKLEKGVKMEYLIVKPPSPWKGLPASKCPLCAEYVELATHAITYNPCQVYNTLRRYHVHLHNEHGLALGNEQDEEQMGLFEVTE